MVTGHEMLNGLMLQLINLFNNVYSVNGEQHSRKYKKALNSQITVTIVHNKDSLVHGI